LTTCVALEESVQFVRGVGPKRAADFANLGVHTVGDLLEHLPFRYELRPESKPIGSLQLGETATIIGELRNVRTRGSYSNQRITAQIVDGTGRCNVQWFNSAYLVDMLHYGQVVRLTGKVDVWRDLASLTNPQLTIVEEDEDPFADDVDRFVPVYPATADLSSRDIRRIVGNVLEHAVESVVEFVPESIRDRRHLPPRRTAFLRCHQPTSPDDPPIARRRLAYDELLLCQLAVQISRRALRRNAQADPIALTDEIDQRIRRRLPFRLTDGQDKVIEEICRDLGAPTPMNRLLQADVGAGKTAVAIYAALTTIANRKQVALLAPTEVLASQHHAKIGHYLQGGRVRTELLIGSTAKSKRAATLRGVAAGEVDWLIGTHALLESEVEFAKLALVIIDEQHKFGVAQRASLRSKGRAPHTLVMTATPIPRTLAMTAFGDLDVSTMRERPPGRQPVETRLVRPAQTGQAWSFVRSRLSQGEQAYIVYPLVEESDALPLKAASVEVKRLSDTVLSGFEVALLHGRMRPGDKARIMEAFRTGRIHALVSTTVIEVGVDVPNATLMVVQHAERYGLSQLHQLRGRIGRGSKNSFCLLFSDTGEGIAAERLEVLCQTDDGFRIAEEDMRIRGPGELLGTRQHGLPTFKVADLVQDIELLELARDDAAAILAGDDTLCRPEHAALRAELLRKYEAKMRLADVA
jgi:ATP-dependent DNA helicase RecG